VISGDDRYFAKVGAKALTEEDDRQKRVLGDQKNTAFQKKKNLNRGGQKTGNKGAGLGTEDQY